MRNKILFFSILLIQNVFGQNPIIPAPTQFDYTSGVLKIQNLVIDTNTLSPELAHYFKKTIEDLYHLPVVYSETNTTINFKQIQNKNEGYYELEVDSIIRISYTSKASCFSGLVSLIQLLNTINSNNELRKCKISDAPKFDWRGLHLDVSRHFFSVDEVKRFIDLMALYKFNKFHWHLTDDQGWRIEIKKYPLLTEVGGTRDSTIVGHYSKNPREYDVNEYSGFYTQEDIKEVIKYAMDRQIDVVPEIEMPGHSRAALSAYPNLSCTKEVMPVPGVWGVFNEVYCSKPETLQFLKDILNEVVALFPYEYIHIGGDEAPKYNWKKCSNCQQLIQDKGLIDEHGLQSYFITQIDEFVSSKGKRIIGWDEILEGGLSPNAAVMSWRGEQGGIEAAQLKHPVVMTPTTYCYFDYYQSSHPSEPLAIGGFLPLNKVYQFNPIPKELSQEFHQYILGGQANLWTEYIIDFDQLMYMTYPRALALSQSVWSMNKPEYEVFETNYLDFHEAFLTKLNVNYSKAIHQPTEKIERTPDGLKIQYQSVIPNNEIQLKSCDPIHEMKVKVNPFLIDRPEFSKDVWECIELSIKDNSYKNTYNYKLHPGIGLPITISPAPHKKFNNNGSLNLVDGVKGVRPWKGSQWLGFTEKEVTLEIDLLSIEKIDGVSIGFLKDEGSWIYLPEAVSIYTSKKGVKWKLLQMDCKVDFEDFTFHKRINKRYMKLVITAMDRIPEGKDGQGNIPWTFIDEVELIITE